VFRRGAGHGNSPLPTDTAPAFYPTRMRESRSVEGVACKHDSYSDSGCPMSLDRAEGACREVESSAMRRTCK
jgi:hypothetical protein